MPTDAMYFFDTYALVESIKGNHAYDKFLDSRMVTSRYNLMEMYYTFLRASREQLAEDHYTLCLRICASLLDTDIKEAMRFRLEQRRKGNLMSYIDAIGYIAAMRRRLIFVTGDPHFRHLPHVEFVP